MRALACAKTSTAAATQSTLGVAGREHRIFPGPASRIGPGLLAAHSAVASPRAPGAQATARRKASDCVLKAGHTSRSSSRLRPCRSPPCTAPPSASSRRRRSGRSGWQGGGERASTPWNHSRRPAGISAWTVSRSSAGIPARIGHRRAWPARRRRTGIVSCFATAVASLSQRLRKKRRRRRQQPAMRR